MPASWQAACHAKRQHQARRSRPHTQDLIVRHVGEHRAGNIKKMRGRLLEPARRSARLDDRSFIFTRY
jgi:hypothetical protein